MFTLLKPTAVFNQALAKKESSINISSSKYKKVLRKLDKEWDKGRANSLVTTYINDNAEQIVIHITDEKLSSIIYKAVASGFSVKDEFCNLKFITVAKSEKTVFAVYKGRIHDVTQKSIVESLISLADYFTYSLGNEVYVHYPTLYLLSEVDHWINALFMSIVFDPVTLAPSDIDIILSIIYSRLDQHLSYKDLKYNLAYSNQPFYTWLRNGLFIESERKYLSMISFPLEINIIRYTLDNAYIKDIHDLFVKSTDIQLFERYERHRTAFVIDEKRFKASIKESSENDDFIIYTNDSSLTFAKLKNPSDYDKITSSLYELKNISGLIGYSVIVSENLGVYIYFNNGREKTLKDSVGASYTSSERFITLLKKLDEWGRAKNKLKKFWMYKDTDFLTTLFQYRIDDDPIFLDPLAISFNATEKSEPFNYRQILFLVIKEYLTLNKIDVKDLYKCEFVKILHPTFTKALIQFLNTGIITLNQQADTFNGLYMEQVEFVENLPTGDTELLSRLTFFKDYTPPDALKQALQGVKSKEAAEGCIDLVNCLAYIKSRDISKNSLKSIFMNPNNKGNGLLAPDKIVISKDVTISGNYKVIGVIWNYGRVKNAFDVIKSNVLSTKDVYLFIHSLIETYIQYDKSIYAIDVTSSNLLISLNSFKPILWEESLNYLRYKASGSSPKEYYMFLLGLLDAKTSFNEHYDVFEFNDLVPNRHRTSYVNQVHQFYNSVQKLKKCTFHSHWHLADKFCPVCAKIFEIVDLSAIEKNPVYTDHLANYYNCGNYTLYAPLKDKNGSKALENIMLGLENDVYQKFVGIIPLRLVQLPGHMLSSRLLLSKIDFNDKISLDTFKHVQRLKVILVMYKKILPRILDKTFICTSKAIFEGMLMHKGFKGEILIPNLELLDNKAILSNDEKLKEEKSKKTLNIFANYLLEYMHSDTYLSTVLGLGLKKFVAIEQDIKSLLFTESVIKSAIETYKNFCFTHMQPFASSRNFCPVCAKDGIKLDYILFKDKAYFTSLTPEKASFDGGEADIHPYDETHVQKIFKPHVDLAFKSKILAKAMEKNALIDEFNQAHTDIRIISAKELLYMKEGGNLTLKGFVQEFVKDSFKISNLKDKDFVREHGYTRKDVVDILIKVCKGIEFIHSIGGFIGDLNGGNILIKGNNVFIIDIDGMSFDDVKNCMYTNMYIYPPSAENGNISALDDWYSLAVQSFYYLTYSHPFRGITDGKKIPATETERMKLGMSVLGEHKILPPSISIGWDFLPNDLLKYFLATFEGKKRESMLSILEAYYAHLERCENMFTEEKRERSVKVVLSPDMYIDANNILIYKERALVNINGYDTISSNEHGILVVVGNCSYFFDFNTESEYRIPKRYVNGAVAISPNAIYYTSTDGVELYVDEFTPSNGSMKTHTIRKPTIYPLIKLRVDEENKFVFVEDNVKQNTYDVYCNSTKVYSILKSQFSSTLKFGIDYDEISKKRIVLFKEDGLTRGVIIDKDSSDITEFRLRKTLSDSVSFYGNTLYYVGNGNIYFYNVSTGAFKSIECEYAKKSSCIYRFGNKFVITNETTSYVYEKS